MWAFEIFITPTPPPNSFFNHIWKITKLVLRESGGSAPPNGLAAGCDIICDLLQYTRTKKCNLFAKYTLNNP